MPLIGKDTCGICQGDPVRKRWVEKELIANTPHTQIEKKSRELGLNVKRETIRRHLMVCVPKAAAETFGYEVESDPAGSAEVGPPTFAPAVPPATVITDGSDFATLVRNEATRRMAAGEIQPRISDGLAAQAIIDKREAKAKDRDLLIQMGQLLGGKNSPPPPVIEGEYTEMDEPLMIEAESVA